MFIVSYTLKNKNSTDQSSLLNALKQIMKRYSVFDFMMVQGFIAKELKYLPSPYKEDLSSKLNEQLFCTFKEICNTNIVKNEPLNIEDYFDFLEYFRSGIKNSAVEIQVDFHIIYNLCAAYNLFITRTPVHPVGTPFPGGFQVHKKSDEYFCPVKDKQKGVFESLCKFCIAKQVERPFSPHAAYSFQPHP